MGNENKKQALSEEQISNVEGGFGFKDLDWKKGAKIAAATAIGATAIGGAAVGGKKLYDSHKKDESVYMEKDDIICTEKDKPIYMDDNGIGHDALSTSESR